MKKDHSWTIDTTTVASNPGNVTLMPLLYLRYYPFWGVTLAIFLVGSIFLIPYSFHFIILLGLLFSLNISYWSLRKTHFGLGDSNPGRVIHKNPTLIAVATNLTKYDTSYPVVKVIKSSLKNVSIGDTIGTIALYSAGKDESLAHWIDFDPIPIYCATNNKYEVDAALRSYSSEQLAALDVAVNSLAKPYKKGLYKIYGDNSAWVKS